MIKIVDDIKDAKFITHSGTMHADEVFATAFLNLYFGDVDLFRISDVNPSDYPNCIVYDIGRGEFDHHQEDRKVRDNGIPYCSFGLLWNRYGLDFLKNRGFSLYEEMFKEIDTDLVEGIDAIDNGIFPKVEANYKIRNLCDIIRLFNPSYASDEDEKTQFLKACDLATMILEEELLSIQGRIIARNKVEALMPEAINKHYLVLDEYMPYEDTIFTKDINKDIYFVVFPSNRGGYSAKTIYISSNDRTSRVPFPEEWAGCNEDLEEVSGVEGATFCHLGRFIVSGKTRESVIKLVEIAIEKKMTSNDENEVL